MEDYKRRAEQAERLLDDLERRVKVLEGTAKSGGSGQTIDPQLKKQLQASAREILADGQKLEAENTRLKAQLAKLKGGKGGSSSGDYEAKLEKVKKTVKSIREQVQALEKENAALKKKAGSSGSTGALTADTKKYITSRLGDLRKEVEILAKENESLKSKLASGGSAPAAPTGPIEAMTFATVVEGGKYTVTKDFDLFKKSWIAAEITEMDDDDYRGFLGENVLIVDKEEDDDTVECRFDNLETKWVPACTLLGVAGQTAVKQGDDSDDDSDESDDGPSGPTGPVYLTVDTAKEGEEYEMTHDLGRLRKEWEAAELGQIEDEDLMNWLGERVKILEIDEDDDTADIVIIANSENRPVPLGALCKIGTQGERKPLPVLTYFNIFGRASKIRLALADCDVTYADITIGAFGEKEKSKLMFGQLPYMQIGKDTYVQSNAILRHVGRRYFCYGEDEDLADMCMEGIADWESLYNKVIYQDKGSAESKDALLKAMTTKPGSGSGNCAQFSNFNKIFKNLFSPFIGGNKPGIADYYLFDLLYKLQRLYSEIAFLIPKNCKKLQEWYDQMKDRPNIARYYNSPNLPKFINANKVGN